MSKRKSITIDGFSHGDQPIPAASRVGPLVITGGVYGRDPESGTIPDDVDSQAKFMFVQLERIFAAAGGSLDSVVRMTVYVKHPDARAAVNAEWVKRFPDPESRPARHMISYDQLSANMLVQCDATGWIGS